MLTDTSRGPFEIKTTGRRMVDKWGREFWEWDWELIGSDGKCFETGRGYASERSARREAAQVAANEVA